MAEESSFEQFIRAEARKLRASDSPAKSREEWDRRRTALRDKFLAAIGPTPDKPCDLEPRVVGTLERDGYRIEKLIFQSRPDVWVTASAYVPKLAMGAKAPAVLVVHGHWAWARRDPVVQARCLGLVKLGFFVLAVDAFGAGERYTKPARGTYHGALYGSTLWPIGYSLLGMQVYDNRRAVDYLLSRKEVSGKIGITGASGGGNQSMNAGALDERLAAVVPVCSVGNYQAYLKAACCVCEVLPGALTFTEEGDVLGLVAPRALLVMNAARDGIQFSPPEAEKSVGRAKDIFKLYGEEGKVRHLVFESGHDYNRPMREAMYGWMTLHLKGEGKGEPIPEPEHKVEKPEDLACFPDPNDRPKGFLTPPLFAGKVGRELVAKADKLAPDHPEMGEATANHLRDTLRALIGPLPVPGEPKLDVGNPPAEGGKGIPWTVTGEGGLVLKAWYQSRLRHKPPQSRHSVVLHFDGEEAARGQPIARTLLESEFDLLTGEMRVTGTMLPKSGAIAGAVDHTSAEHGVWIGRPLLGQWVCDALTLLRALKPGRDTYDLIAGIGAAAIVALVAGARSESRPRSIVAIDLLATYVTDAPYASGTPMGILAPGILKVGDIPHLAGLIAPRRLVIAGGVSPQGKKLTQKELDDSFRFTAGVYKAMKVPEKLTIVAEPDWRKIEL